MKIDREIASRLMAEIEEAANRLKTEAGHAPECLPVALAFYVTTASRLLCPGSTRQQSDELTRRLKSVVDAWADQVNNPTGKTYPLPTDPFWRNS